MNVKRLVPSLSMGVISTAALLALGLATRAAAEQPIRPGLWDSTETYSVLLSASSHDRKCLTETEIGKFLAAPSTKHYSCTYQHREITGGGARFRGGACFSRAGREVLSDVNIDGAYAPDRFHLDLRYRFMLNPKLGVPGTGAIDAHRISADCPANTPPGK